MERDDALELLPPLYAVALRLDDAGADAALIATATGIEIESVPSLVAVAHTKLNELLPPS
jgi:hypothetical protein